MISEQEALVTVLLGEVRESLRARLGDHTIRAEGGEIVATHRGKEARVDIPEIRSLFVDAFKVAGALETLLTGEE